MKQLHIHALGINTGGGLVLLRQLLASKNTLYGCIILDDRIKKEFSNCAKTKFYKHGFLNELKSQLELRKLVGNDDHVLFFSNRPPIIKFPCKVSVFHQNALLLGKINITDIKSRINHLWFKLFKKNADQFIVQNQFMRKLLSQHGCINTSVIVAPFFNFKDVETVFSMKDGFIYVSSFEPHKNHYNLVKAWEYLVYHGVKEKLTLIVSGSGIKDLERLVNRSHSEKFIDIQCNKTHDEVLLEYKKHKALIYPSKVESFGLPLLEAKRSGLAIIASELDYVRDIIVPDQSFDPNSYKSIARSVMRFLQINENKKIVLTSEEFVNTLLEKTKVSVQKAS